jgi:hypothetical protein
VIDLCGSHHILTLFTPQSAAWQNEKACAFAVRRQKTDTLPSLLKTLSAIDYLPITDGGAVIDITVTFQLCAFGIFKHDLFFTQFHDGDIGKGPGASVPICPSIFIRRAGCGSPREPHRRTTSPC